MKVAGEKTAAVFLEKRPDLFAVGPGDVELSDFVRGEKLKLAFLAGGGDVVQAGQDFKQENVPVRVALVAILADEPGEVQVAGCDFQSGFLLCLAAGARVGGLAPCDLDLAAGRYPTSKIWRLVALEQEEPVVWVEAVEQRGQFVWQRHRAYCAGCRGDWQGAAGFRDGLPAVGVVD